MKKTTSSLGLCLLALNLAACATNPNNIPTASVSPLQYADYDCN